MQRKNRKFNLKYVKTRTATALAIGLSVLFFASKTFALTISDLEFKQEDGNDVLVIRGDSEYQAQTTENATDHQWIIDIPKAGLTSKTQRPLDTSSFESPVALVSTYEVDGNVRVVVQLRQNAKAEFAQNGNEGVLKIANPLAKAGGNVGEATAANAISNQPPQNSQPEAPSAAGSSIEGASSAQLDSNPGSVDPIQTFIQNRDQKKFSGKPISLNARDVDLVDLFRLISEASGFNIVLGEGVQGKESVSLNQVPWDQVLDVVLRTHKLGAERNNNVLRIVTLTELTNEKQQELAAKKAADEAAPRVTRVFPINYADLGSLTALIASFGSTNSGDSKENKLTVVQSDSRTNSLIVQSTSENIERIRKIIELLDTQTPMVMIEAKVVEVTDNFAKNMGGSLGFGDDSQDIGKSGDPFMNVAHYSSFNQGNPLASLVGSSGVFADGAAIGATTGSGGGFGFSIGFLKSNIRLNAILSFGEKEEEVKVVSSPKLAVLNKTAANIVQGTPILVPGTTTVAGVGEVQLTRQETANLSLGVTPTVTNDNSVLMNLNVTRDIPFPSGVGNRSITTQVLVDSGSTLVIGGIYTSENKTSSSGFPILRKLPLIGWLFGSEGKSEAKSELFIFVTPRILNQREAGLTANNG